jgi:competence protein ComEC
MLVIFMLGIIFLRRFSAARIYFLTLVLVLIHDPYSVTQAGFWLSFLAVAILLFLFNRNRQDSAVMRWGRAQWGLMLGLLPLNLLYFQGVSVIAPLANLIAIPWVGLGVLPAALSAGLMNIIGLPFAETLAYFAANSLDYLFLILTILSRPDLAWMSLPQPSSLVLLLMMAAGLLILLPFRVVGPLAAICLLLPLARPPAGPEHGAFWLDVLDVGDGQSAIIRTRHHTLIFDTGPRLGEHFDTGAAVVVPFLNSRGIGQVSVLMISHGDNDHAGGAASVLSMKQVELHIASEQGKSLQPDMQCIAGQHWHWEGVDFEILHPDRDWPFPGNDGSCVLLVYNDSQRLLIPGDIEGLAELRLSREYDIQADVLLVPHHGSKTSSSQVFLDAVSPTVAIVSAGRSSRYGFPHPQVVSRYRKAGISFLNTAETGHIHMKFEGDSRPLAWDTYMPASRRYWNSPSSGE